MSAASLRRRATTGLAVGAVGLAAAASAYSAPASTAGAYKGKTSHGLPVSFRISAGRVRSFSLTVHALCISVVAGGSQLDPVIHHITPPVMKLSAAGSFAKAYRWPNIQNTEAKVDGRVRGRTASGHYRISYDFSDGYYIWSCQDKGTWSARRH